MSGETRQCDKCRRVLALTKENFRFHKRGISWTCLHCLREYSRRYYTKHKPRVNRRKVPDHEKRIRALIKHYDRVIRKLGRLGIDIGTTKYTAAQTDEILKHGKKAISKSEK